MALIVVKNTRSRLTTPSRGAWTGLGVGVEGKSRLISRLEIHPPSTRPVGATSGRCFQISLGAGFGRARTPGVDRECRHLRRSGRDRDDVLRHWRETESNCAATSEDHQNPDRSYRRECLSCPQFPPETKSCGCLESSRCNRSADRSATDKDIEMFP